MMPGQFKPIKKDLLEAAHAKLTEDFIEKVKKSNTNTNAESSTTQTTTPSGKASPSASNGKQDPSASGWSSWILYISHHGSQWT